MHGRRGRASRGIRAVPLLALLAITLVLVAAGQGGSSAGTKGGFGEKYQAKTKTLKKALFNAKLLPANKTARNIALASLGRSEKKVNLNLALKCWKNNGCSTGTGGKVRGGCVQGFWRKGFPPLLKAGV